MDALSLAVTRGFAIILACNDRGSVLPSAFSASMLALSKCWRMDLLYAVSCDDQTRSEETTGGGLF